MVGVAEMVVVENGWRVRARVQAECMASPVGRFEDLRPELPQIRMPQGFELCDSTPPNYLENDR
jgi:hypothetical protein